MGHRVHKSHNKTRDNEKCRVGLQSAVFTGNPIRSSNFNRHFLNSLWFKLGQWGVQGSKACMGPCYSYGVYPFNGRTPWVAARWRPGRNITHLIVPPLHSALRVSGGRTRPSLAPRAGARVGVASRRLPVWRSRCYANRRVVVKHLWYFQTAGEKTFC